MKKKIYDLNELLGSKIRLPQWLARVGERALGLDFLNDVHGRIVTDWEQGVEDNFFALACKHFNLQYDLNESALDHIPKEGACVIVANHPHGLSDGIMFGDIAMKVRSDIRVVVNEFLEAIDGMRPYTISVDVYGGDKAKRANMSAMRDLMKWLRAGHCVLVFPSGSVSTYSKRDRCVIEDPWQTNMISVIRKTQAQVVPLHISGSTSPFFQFISRIHKPIRGNFLPREIVRDCRTRHTIRVGSTISSSMHDTYSSDEALTDYLKLRTLLLSYPSQADMSNMEDRSMQFTAIAEDIPQQKLSEEISKLPEDALYYEGSTTGLQIYVAQAENIPLVMQQIAISRERTFRVVGEGTGLAYDRDEYDEYYHHLFMWDSKKQRLAGAYRMGLSDKILQEYGTKGIYNGQFFRFADKMLPVLTQGIEMGRAFLATEYQGLAASLDTLWMGIGRYVLRHPQYRYLYGTVSISQAYSPCSRALMHSYLQVHEMQEDYAPLVTALCAPLQDRLLPSEEDLLKSTITDVKQLSKLVSDVEGKEVAIPILLKHYMRLAGKMLSFGLDESFGNTLDCLVLVDLEKTPARILRRYQGLTGTES